MRPATRGETGSFRDVCDARPLFLFPGPRPRVLPPRRLFSVPNQYMFFSLFLCVPSFSRMDERELEREWEDADLAIETQREEGRDRALVLWRRCLLLDRCGKPFVEDHRCSYRTCVHGGTIELIADRLYGCTTGGTAHLCVGSDCRRIHVTYDGQLVCKQSGRSMGAAAIFEPLVSTKQSMGETGEDAVAYESQGRGRVRGGAAAAAVNRCTASTLYDLLYDRKSRNRVRGSKQTHAEKLADRCAVAHCRRCIADGMMPIAAEVDRVRDEAIRGESLPELLTYDGERIRLYQRLATHLWLVVERSTYFGHNRLSFHPAQPALACVYMMKTGLKLDTPEEGRSIILFRRDEYLRRHLPSENELEGWCASRVRSRRDPDYTQQAMTRGTNCIRMAIASIGRESKEERAEVVRYALSLGFQLADDGGGREPDPI